MISAVENIGAEPGAPLAPHRQERRAATCDYHRLKRECRCQYFAATWSRSLMTLSAVCCHGDAHRSRALVAKRKYLRRVIATTNAISNVPVVRSSSGHANRNDSQSPGAAEEHCRRWDMLPSSASERADQDTRRRTHSARNTPSLATLPATIDGGLKMPTPITMPTIIRPRRRARLPRLRRCGGAAFRLLRACTAASGN